MRISFPVFEFKINAIGLTAAAIIMVVVLLAANVTITNAQQQEEQQPSTSQPTTTSSVTQNGTTARTTSFESAKDSFRVQLPEGWVIQDVNNTGFTLAAEVLQGYGILAQLCPTDEREEGGQQEQQPGALTNVSSSTGSCEQQQAQEEIIHIIRYPNLGPRLGITLADINDNVTASVLNYQIQKLYEVGYGPIRIVNITETAIPVHYSSAPGVPAFVPATLVEITYSTDSAPSEIRRGYIILTATNITPPNLQTITGYSIFYEGASGATAAAVEVSTSSGSLSPAPAAVVQILNSFELIASEEGVQTILSAIAQQAALSDEPNDQVEEAEDGEDGDGEDEDGDG
jgi:uncharacterized membrane protein